MATQIAEGNQEAMEEVEATAETPLVILDWMEQNYCGVDSQLGCDHEQKVELGDFELQGLFEEIEEEEFDGFNEIVSETELISTNNEEHDDVASPKKVVISNCLGEQKYTFVGNQVVSDELGDLELFEKINKVEFETINEITSKPELMSPNNEEHDEVAIVKKVETNKGECSICLEKFGENLRKHNIKHHTVSSLYVHPCDHCSKWFPSLEVLEEHEANHSKDKDRKEELPSLTMLANSVVISV